MSPEQEPQLRRSSLEVIEDLLLLLISSSDEQEKWAKAERVPAEEMALFLYDLNDTWIPGLMEAGVIDELDREALADLVHLLGSDQTKLFVGYGVNSAAPEWEGIRAQTHFVLDLIRRHVPRA